MASVETLPARQVIRKRQLEDNLLKLESDTDKSEQEEDLEVETLKAENLELKEQLEKIQKLYDDRYLLPNDEELLGFF
jgi:hypothetical protein